MKKSRLICLLLCSMSITYGATTKWPDISKVGYYENLNYSGENNKTTPTIQEMSDHHYNVVVTAFATVNNTDVRFYDNKYNNSGYAPYADKKAFVEAIDKFHNDADMNKALIAVGGWPNLWFPGNADNVELAKNMVDFAAENHEDGYEFDLENGAEAYPTRLQQIISEMKKEAKRRSEDFPNGFFISAAPQLKPTYHTPPTFLNWAQANGDFADAQKLKDYDGNPLFDIVMVQLYNMSKGLKDYGKSLSNSLSAIDDDLAQKAIVILLKPTSIEMEGPWAQTQIENQDPDHPDTIGYITPESMKEQVAGLLDNREFRGIGFWSPAGDKYGDWSMTNAIIPALDRDNVDPTPTPAPDTNPSQWSADKVYLEGDKVTYENRIYTARWWTKGDIPTNGGVWKIQDAKKLNDSRLLLNWVHGSALEVKLNLNPDVKEYNNATADVKAVYPITFKVTSPSLGNGDCQSLAVYKKGTTDKVLPQNKTSLSKDGISEISGVTYIDPNYYNIDLSLECTTKPTTISVVEITTINSETYEISNSEIK